ncbi:hypothetical protein WN51_01274 [Melipona quadrifasciata]|uniref:Uncharacterized protein n=1 Tax=Melipona quadrifasciata TaxID=166423 RepID=A0A0M8ZZG9_9HYME|nr:hypothetical protein WN51_01274 [Melipona quadrifasciata]
MSHTTRKRFILYASDPEHVKSHRSFLHCNAQRTPGISRISINILPSTSDIECPVAFGRTGSQPIPQATRAKGPAEETRILRRLNNDRLNPSLVTSLLESSKNLFEVILRFSSISYMQFDINANLIGSLLPSTLNESQLIQFKPRIPVTSKHRNEQNEPSARRSRHGASRTEWENKQKPHGEEFRRASSRDDSKLENTNTNMSNILDRVLKDLEQDEFWNIPFHEKRITSRLVQIVSLQQIAINLKTVLSTALLLVESLQSTEKVSEKDETAPLTINNNRLKIPIATNIKSFQNGKAYTEYPMKVEAIFEKSSYERKQKQTKLVQIPIAFNNQTTPLFNSRLQLIPTSQRPFSTNNVALANINATKLLTRISPVCPLRSVLLYHNKFTKTNTDIQSNVRGENKAETGRRIIDIKRTKLSVETDRLLLYEILGEACRNTMFRHREKHIERDLSRWHAIRALNVALFSFPFLLSSTLIRYTNTRIGVLWPVYVD